MKSTMGAPLNDAEIERIRLAWGELYYHSLSIPAESDAAAMLNFVTDTIMKCYEVRRAIDGGWYYANKRAFPAPTAKLKPNQALANALSALTEEQIEEVLNAIQEGSQHVQPE
jgi:hypothetical protein